jgi:hypothetical protein
MSTKTVTQTLASAVATSGTFTVTYPSGTNAAWFQKGSQHRIAALGGDFTSPEDFGITTFGNTTCTVTWRNTVTLPAGTVVRIGLDAPGGRWLDEPPVIEDPGPNRVSEMHVQRVTLGAPIVADVDGVSTATPTSGAYTLNGAAVSGGVAVFDVPRNVTFAPPAGVTFTGATITGKDLYENTMIETVAANSGAGTVVAGIKAFKTVTAIAPTSTQTGTIVTGTVGFGDVLGVPVRIPTVGVIIRELEDGATAVAGTFVGGLDQNTASTATTADVRGTYDPNSACNGTKAFELIVALSDPTFLGVPQYDG